MAASRMFCSAALLLFCSWGALGSLDTALGDSSSCHHVCEGTYPLHTYPEEEELFACHRGCRLFSICQFAGIGEDLNKTKLECESACTEAYSQSNEQYACILGCNSQMPFAEKRQEELSDMVPRIHVLFPLTMVKAFWSDMMDSAQSFISSSWTFYIQADNGRILIVQSQPEIQQMPPLYSENPSARGNLLDTVQNLVPEDRAGEGPWSKKGDFMELERGASIMKCLAMNSNWLLTATLILSILVLLWICCATVATASDQYVLSEPVRHCTCGQQIMGAMQAPANAQSSCLPVPPTSRQTVTEWQEESMNYEDIQCSSLKTKSHHPQRQTIDAALQKKLSIYGDLEYLNDEKLYKYPSASLVVVHGAPQENEEAGPLPTKVDLAKSAI